MMFNILENVKKSGELIYRSEEYSFDTIGGEFSNTSIMINDISLGINGDTKRIVQVWGFSPQAKWINMSCALPRYIDGGIVVVNESNMLHSTRINDTMLWKEYYNPAIGWLCIDSGNFRFCKDKCICFMNNAMALVKNGKILSLWLKVK